jgi:hypothetical protein
MCQNNNHLLLWADPIVATICMKDAAVAWMHIGKFTSKMMMIFKTKFQINFLRYNDGDL